MATSLQAGISSFLWYFSIIFCKVKEAYLSCEFEFHSRTKPACPSAYLVPHRRLPQSHPFLFAQREVHQEMLSTPRYNELVSSSTGLKDIPDEGSRKIGSVISSLLTPLSSGKRITHACIL